MSKQEKETKESLIKKIKQKKELSGLSEEIIADSLEKHLKDYQIPLSMFKPKEINILVKDIRAELRNLTGRFQKGVKSRIKLIPIGWDGLLKTHSSTAERLDFYPELKKIINSLKPKSILDLGCGLNPIALANKSVTYYASDIKEDELSLINQFFNENKISGKTFIWDLRKEKQNLPEVDLCIIFKVLDIIASEKERSKITRRIFRDIKCKNFLISFATKKISGKRMNNPKRFWFEETLKGLNLRFETFSSDNEIFYLVPKNQQITSHR